MIKAILFDLDGVLIDSTPIVDRVRRETFAMHGVDIDSVPDPHQQGYKGSSTKNVIAQVKKHTGIAIDEQAYSDEFTKGVRDGLSSAVTEVDPQLKDLLADLKKHNIICAIVTSSRAGSLKVKMDILQIHAYFKIMVTADDVVTHKPAPDLYLCAMERLKLQPEECIVFEDSNAGVEAGVAAGCKVIGFTKYSAQKSALPKTMQTIDSWDAISADYLVNIK